MPFIPLALLLVVAMMALSVIKARAEPELRIHNTTGNLHNSLTYDISDFRVGPYVVLEAKGSILIPPRRVGRDWSHYHDIWLCTDGTTQGVHATSLANPPTLPPVPIGSFCSMVSSWGTNTYLSGSGSDLMIAEQRGKRVTFRGDFDFDYDMSYPRNGDGTWYERGNYGAWPYGGRVSAVWIRAEAGRKHNEGAGLAQVNFTTSCTHGSRLGNEPSHVIREQHKGYSDPGNTSSYGRYNILRDPGSPDAFCVAGNDRSIYAYLNDGYEMVWRTYVKP